MDKNQLIQQIEGLRGSRVITYLTSDRQGPINARVAMDIIPIVSKQLQSIRKTENIDLFLYSAGGDTMVPWRLVSMIREYSVQSAQRGNHDCAWRRRDCHERPFRTLAD
jgi:hypothetical protein